MCQSIGTHIPYFKECDILLLNQDYFDAFPLITIKVNIKIVGRNIKELLGKLQMPRKIPGQNDLVINDPISINSQRAMSQTKKYCLQFFMFALWYAA